jgi:hypothetical protein
VPQTFAFKVDEWAFDNDGRGRRNPQFDEASGDQEYFRSPQEMKDYAKNEYTDKKAAEDIDITVDT